MTINKTFLCMLLSCICLPCVAYSSDQISTLSQAIEKTLESNPNLKSFSPKLAAAKANINQASLLPNPVLGFEVEDFGGQLDGFNQSESTISIDQPIPLGGKINAKKELASTQLELAEKQNQVQLYDLLSQVKIAYLDLVFSKTLITIQQEQVKLSKKVLSSVTKRHNAGAVLLLEKTKAEILLKQDLIELKKAKNLLKINKQSLVSFWGGEIKDVANLEKEKLELGEIEPYLEKIDINNIPIFETTLLDRKIAKKAQNLAKANRVPNMAIGLGYRRLEQTETNAFLARVSFGLPILNRNQGSIQASINQSKVANLNSSSIKLQVTREIQNLQSSLEIAKQEFDLIKQTIIPKAKQAYYQAKKAYDQGRGAYLDLTDARRTLFTTKTREQEVLLTANRAKVGIEKFTGSLNGEY